MNRLLVKYNIELPTNENYGQSNIPSIHKHIQLIQPRLYINIFSTIPNYTTNDFEHSLNHTIYMLTLTRGCDHKTDVQRTLAPTSGV